MPFAAEEAGGGGGQTAFAGPEAPDGPVSTEGSDGTTSGEGPVAGTTGSDPASGGGSTGAGGVSGRPGQGPTGATAAEDAAGATDVGVTADTIKLGFLILDVGSLGGLGIAVPGIDPQQQIDATEAYLADINERGGIHGRKVVGAYRTFDVFSQDSMRAACLGLTRDEKVFAISAAGGFNGPALLCVTVEHRTPMLNNGSVGTPSEYVRRSEGRMLSLFQASDRLMPNWAVELDHLGVLDGKKIGIVTGEQFDPGKSVVEGALVPELRRLGHNVVHVSRFAYDQGVGASQVPVQVQQMRGKGVDFVLLTTSILYSTQFVQAADNQGYRPQYSVSDWGSMSNDTSNQNMPDAYDGTIVVTETTVGEEKVGIGESQIQRECRDVYERRTGQSSGKKGENLYGVTQGYCQMARLLEAGLGQAGRQLTRASFLEGMQRIGPFPMTSWFSGSFAPGKLDAADASRVARWYADCACIKPDGPIRRNRY